MQSNPINYIFSDLISNGEDINQRGPGGQTPLMNAVLSGQTEVVKALLELGADHKIPEKDGYTPMHGAGFQGHVQANLEAIPAHYLCYTFFRI